MNVSIRPAAPGDAETIAAFNLAMARETEHIELDRAKLLPGVRAVLQDPAKGFYVVAETGGQVVGQMMITYEWSDWRNATFWWIQSVYVSPEFRGKGVFKQLYRHVADRARAQTGVCGLRLYVEADNHSAQRTYERLGLNRTMYDVWEVDFVIRRQQ